MAARRECVLKDGMYLLRNAAPVCGSEQRLCKQSGTAQAVLMRQGRSQALLPKKRKRERKMLNNE